MEKFKVLQIDSNERLKGVIDLIFEKVRNVDEFFATVPTYPVFVRITN